MKSFSEPKNSIKAEALVWDWNGTLLNDVHICVDSINAMLGLRNIPQLNYNTYREVFGFPVRDYYEKAGFDFTQEPFDTVAVEFIDIYRRKLRTCSLFEDVFHILETFSANKLPQYVLSAMEQQMLEDSLNEKGITRFFKYIAGTGDHFADGKLGSARRLQSIIGSDPSVILLVGDTIHDFEVAEEMGWQCILISNGHQTEERLMKTGKPVFQNLTMLKRFLNGHSV